MERFNGLQSTCYTLGILGWLAIIPGIIGAVIVAERAGAIVGILAGAVALASSIGTVILTGAVEVLIGIYQNTCPKEVRIDA